MSHSSARIVDHAGCAVKMARAGVLDYLGQVAPLVAVGVELVEKMVVTVVINRPVRVVHPLGRRVEMIDGARGIGLGLH